MTEIAAFSRPFSAGDDLLFLELTNGLAGQRCWQVDALYGGALRLHFGDRIQGRRWPRGSWVITCWGGDLVLTQGAQVTESRQAAPAEVYAAAEREIGAAIASVRLDADSLALELAMSSGTTVRIELDASCEGEAWAISLPSRQTLAVNSDRTWSLEDAPRLGRDAAGERRTPGPRTS
ncbi:MAG TPA: hypothetical protein VJU82_07405 [Acidobacteriaceae bacterium]|nr:hypothetical protein [Acidobacteriaceae bacterium]